MLGAEVEYGHLPIYRDELARALNFTPADLQENRAGRLSQPQAAARLRGITRSVVKSIVLIILAAGCVASWIAIGVAGVVGLLFLVLAATFLAWVGVLAWFMFPVWEDARGGLVSSVEGFVLPLERVTTISVGAQGIPIWSYYWTVDDGQRFWVPGQAYPVLTPARHRLYFLPSSRRIVAAEPI
jgi:hypothetical protein